MPNSESSFLHQGAATLGTNGWHAPTLDSEQKFHVSQQSSNTTLSYRHGSAGGRLHHSLGCDFMILLALAGTNNIETFAWPHVPLLNLSQDVGRGGF